VLSAKVAQLASTLPAMSVLGASGSVTTDERRRSPSEPESTSTSSIVWQVEVPGTQMVTLVKRPFT
jgi:hypothetical protein